MTCRPEILATRRRFLRQGGGCAAWIAAGLPWPAAAPGGQVVAEADFARVEALGDGVWAVVSTPLRNGGRHFATTANGGIVAGSDSVAVIEGFMTDEGAAWVAERTRELTGRAPDVAILSHFHGDHCAGLAGLGPRVRPLATPTTARLMAARSDITIAKPELTGEGERRIDLGGRTLVVTPRLGHTPSDVTIRLDGLDVVWCGDLVWNRMFPNFMDAIPSHQVRHCERILGEAGVTYVPGHGDTADATDLAPYLALLQDLEEAARRAHAVGLSAADAASSYRIPDALGEWTMFSPDYVSRAFEAWERELRG